MQNGSRKWNAIIVQCSLQSYSKNEERDDNRSVDSFYLCL